MGKAKKEKKSCKRKAGNRSDDEDFIDLEGLPEDATIEILEARIVVLENILIEKSHEYHLLEESNYVERDRAQKQIRQIETQLKSANKKVENRDAKLKELPMKLKAQIEARTKKNLKRATDRAVSASKKLAAATKKIQNELQPLKSTVTKQRKEITGLKSDLAQQIRENSKLKKTVKVQETCIQGFNKIHLKVQQETAKCKLKHQ